MMKCLVLSGEETRYGSRVALVPEVALRMALSLLRVDQERGLLPLEMWAKTEGSRS